MLAERDLLEPSTLAAQTPDYLANKHSLTPAPIPREWILEGNPLARNRHIAGSTDGRASTYMWDCTAGRFNWFYGVDETVYLLEGSITVVGSTGQVNHLRAGDTFCFPEGTRFQWTVPTYVRKIAFIHVPISPKLRFVMRISRAVTGLLRGKRATPPGGDSSPTSDPPPGASGRSSGT
jgi:uncharacterized cupin superfamily protein